LEGFGERNADYGSGFGLNAEPDCYIETLTEKDTWVMLSAGAHTRPLFGST
jgi:protein phosphatase 1L